MITPEEVEAGLKLCEAATPGPWEPCLGSGNCEMTALAGDNNGTFVCDFVPDWALQLDCDLSRKDDDMAFIAAARDLLPRALEEVKKLQRELTILGITKDREIDKLREENGWLKDDNYVRSIL